MATWQEIGQDNFRAAREMYHNQHYRSSVSRCYYAAYSVITHALLQTAFQPKADREAPDHAHLPEWIKSYLSYLTLRQRAGVATLIRRLYDDRLTADYKLRTTDELTAREALRNMASVFAYLGVEL